MVEARPKNEDGKFGGDDRINYHNFKMRFQSVTNVEGANPLDVINELTHWLKGAPLKLANAHIGSKDPKKALKEIWRQLDLYYSAQIQTASERLKPIMAKGRVNKDDIDGLIEFMSEMLTIQTQLATEGMEEDLDRQDIIRDIFNKKLPFMSEEFYKAEIKKQKKDPKMRMKFEDMLQAISDKIRTMKAQGMSSKKDDAKIASFDGKVEDTWSSKAASPPKQNPAPKTAVIKCFYCSASHPLEKCNKLRNMPVEKRTEILRQDKRCFRCLQKDDHIAKFCQREGFKCMECPYNHPTILHGLYELRQKKRQEQKQAQGSNENQKHPRNVKRPNNGNEASKPETSGAPSTSGTITTTSSEENQTHNVNSI